MKSCFALKQPPHITQSNELGRLKNQQFLCFTSCKTFLHYSPLPQMDGARLIQLENLDSGTTYDIRGIASNGPSLVTSSKFDPSVTTSGEGNNSNIENRSCIL